MGPRLAQRIGLGLAAPLGHGLGEIGKKHGNPQPDCHLEAKADGLTGRSEKKADRGDQGAYLGYKHHGISHHRCRVQFLKRGTQGLDDDMSIEE